MSFVVRNGCCVLEERREERAGAVEFGSVGSASPEHDTIIFDVKPGEEVCRLN